MFWTENGGAIAFIEATIMSGRSNLILTGSLGEVMQESAQAALSYLRANAAMFGLEEGFFNEHDIHIHVPAAAVPKDGPSAGLTIAMALLSRLSNRPAKRNVALTGELTLSGRILSRGRYPGKDSGRGPGRFGYHNCSHPEPRTSGRIAARSIERFERLLREFRG
jgi:ATP-dependent Lon protease